jgi:hypothetical protein
MHGLERSHYSALGVRTGHDRRTIDADIYSPRPVATRVVVCLDCWTRSGPKFRRSVQEARTLG